MLLGSIQMSGEKLSDKDTEDLCKSLETHSVRLLSLRECEMTDLQFAHLSRALARCRTLLHLNMNLGIVCSLSRAEQLAAALGKNRPLTALLQVNL